MKLTALAAIILLAGVCVWADRSTIHAQSAALAAPGFHHLHLNSTNPEAAVDFYTRQFASTSKTTWAGVPALKSPNNVLVLFNKVASPPSTKLETAIWHFGWHVVDVRKHMEMYKQRKDVTLLPLYTGDGASAVFVSSDTWPGTGGVLGLTSAQIADAKAKGVQPVGGAGFAYLQGPDNAIVEYQGNMPVERFNHVHMFWDEPFCAQLWYQTHLSATVGGRGSQRTESTCRVERGPDTTWPALEREGMFRTPSATVTFGDVGLFSYMRQGDRPAVGTRGNLADHFALSVTDLDAWTTKLRAAGVMFLQQTYKIADTRAVMIEGPSHEAIELVEVK